MGLDMYFSAGQSLSEKYGTKEESTRHKKIRPLFEDIPVSNNLNSVTVNIEVGYLRKANQIHKWLVDNIQDGVDECQKSYFSKEDIKKLKRICENVLENKELAKELLPVDEGFFFGGTEYDEYYFDGIKRALKICSLCLELSNKYEIYYTSSW